MKQLLTAVLAVVGGLAAILVLALVFQGADFFWYKAFAPKYEEVRRETFEQSRAYNEGVAQELSQLQLDYVRATSDSEKDAVASMVLRRVAGYDESRLAPDLQAFVREIKAARGVAQ